MSINSYIQRLTQHNNSGEGYDRRPRRPPYFLLPFELQYVAQLNASRRSRRRVYDAEIVFPVPTTTTSAQTASFSSQM